MEQSRLSRIMIARHAAARSRTCARGKTRARLTPPLFACRPPVRSDGQKCATGFAGGDKWGKSDEGLSSANDLPPLIPLQGGGCRLKNLCLQTSIGRWRRHHATTPDVIPALLRDHSDLRRSSTDPPCRCGTSPGRPRLRAGVTPRDRPQSSANAVSPLFPFHAAPSCAIRHT